MSKEFPRSRRMAEQVKRSVSEIIRSELGDPRVSRVTLSEVEVSRDLAHAKVYVVPLFGEENPDEMIDALNHAAGFIRSELGKRLKARLTPTLRFIYDHSYERADEISRLIDRALRGDSNHDE
jgi:ribosome-binding factor A